MNVHQESVDADGGLRRGWESVVNSFTGLTPTERRELGDDVQRLLADDGVTYTPTTVPTLVEDAARSTEASGAAVAGIGLASPQPWQLDAVPFVVDGGEWAGLEIGLAQRADLLDRVLVDLYTDQRLLADGAIPPQLVYGHGDYLRPLVGPAPAGVHRLTMTGADLGRDEAGEWHVVADRTQAPSGAGYAMQNRRIISRVLPELYRASHLFRLTPYFHALRMALVDAAGAEVEDPRVVVLSPGTHSETAFDQAFLASLLGFPLVEGSDLVVDQGRVWLRGMPRREPVDVILRRVDADWTDPLELRSGSRLGVTGLVECVRSGSVAVVNSLGSGVMENPALYAYLPQLCTELLGEELRLPSVPTWWCGDPTMRRRVRADLGDMVIRTLNRGDGRSVRPGELGADARRRLWERIDAEPHRFVAQQLLPLSSAPTLVAEPDRPAGAAPDSAAADVTAAAVDGLVTQPVILRTFTIRRGAAYRAMPGGLAQLPDRVGEETTGRRGRLTKDVWVVSADAASGGPGETLVPQRLPGTQVLGGSVMVPRVLDDLFWFGRYAERAEDLMRLVLAVRHVVVETDDVLTPGGELEVLARAVTHLSSTYPGFVDADPDPLLELRALVLDATRPGTVARSVGALGYAAQGVRDQLSADVWMVLAGIDRALTALQAARHDRGNQLVDSGERILSGLLALTGITAENMVRDAGWNLLDVGRGVERALQVLSLLQHTLVAHRRPEVEEAVIEAALVAAESIVTFRRRYPRGLRHADVVDLLIRDGSNPRSVAFQLHRVRARLLEVPGTEATSRPLRLVADLLERLETEPWSELSATVGADVTDAVPGEGGDRTDLAERLAELHESVTLLADAIAEQYLQRAPAPRSIGFDDQVAS